MRQDIIRFRTRLSLLTTAHTYTRSEGEIPVAWISTSKQHGSRSVSADRAAYSEDNEERNPPTSNNLSEDQNAPATNNLGATYYDTHGQLTPSPPKDQRSKRGDQHQSDYIVRQTID